MAHTLHLTLKKKWFDMILSGEKREEYRELKPYWMKRFHVWGNAFDEARVFNQVEFKNGYSANARAIVIECLGIRVGNDGNPAWGFEGKECYIISLGKILSTKNITHNQ